MNIVCGVLLCLDRPCDQRVVEENLIFRGRWDIGQGHPHVNRLVGKVANQRWCEKQFESRHGSGVRKKGIGNLGDELEQVIG